MHAELAIVEEDGFGTCVAQVRPRDLDWPIGTQHLAQALGEEDGVRVDLDVPVVVAVPAILVDCLPHPDEDVRVHGQAPLASTWAAQRALDQRRGELPSGGAEDRGLVGVHGEVLAGEDAHALGVLPLEQAWLVAKWEHQREAEEGRDTSKTRSRWRRSHVRDHRCRGRVRVSRCAVSCCALRRGSSWVGLPVKAFSIGHPWPDGGCCEPSMRRHGRHAQEGAEGEDTCGSLGTRPPSTPCDGFLSLELSG
mmetsp:Transcript_18268/g.48224  ORF Transcript_18268/g.48224 Transcript_18268/m.48224 type:complete len:251 (-) Transcript_18268:98-850(-)